MPDRQSTQAYCPARLPQRVRERPQSWLAGHVLVGVTAPADSDPERVIAVVREGVEKALGDIRTDPAASSEDPPLVIPGGEQDAHLVFVRFKLVSLEARVMRQAIARINDAEHIDFPENVRLVAAIPNWFGAAQQDCCGGSPSSYPAPAEPFGSRIRYAPRLEELDRAHAAARAAHEISEVVVLDTAPRAADLTWALSEFRHNAHLRELNARFIQPVGSLPPSAFESARVVAMQALDAGGFRPVELAEPIDIRDHGLFVASVVHAVAPWAPIRLVRVLNDFGIGSVHSLLVALAGVLQVKRREQRIVVNLSLGMLPALEQLAYLWFGFSVPGLPGCPEDTSLQFLPGEPDVSPAELEKLIESDDGRIQRTVDRLHEPILRLMERLEAHNCLVVAAAGNDSVYRGTDRRPRWNPRIPARYDSVLGVAADVRPASAARYSNRGEYVGAKPIDAVATLGGDLASDGVSPLSGVLGVYSAEQFPALPGGAPALFNDTGWAEWSGTSFATPILAGIAANVWATHPGFSATRVLEHINHVTQAEAGGNMAELDVPGIPVRLIWEP